MISVNSSDHSCGLRKHPCVVVGAILVMLSLAVPTRGTADEQSKDTHAFLIIMDGARADVVDRLIASGDMPNLEKYVVRRGIRVQNAFTCFPSCTGPAYVPFATGLYPGNAGIPGLRWYDRPHDKSIVYYGTEHHLINDDLTDRCRTIYELVPHDSTSVFGFVDRGCDSTYYPFFSAPLFPVDSQALDRTDFRVFSMKAFMGGHIPRFGMISFHAADHSAHLNGFEHPDYVASLKTIDTLIGNLAGGLISKGIYDRSFIIVSADHGHSLSPQSQNITEYLQNAGLLVRDAIMAEAPIHNALRDAASAYDVHVEVSGNAFVQLYLTAPGGPQERPWTIGEIERLATRDGKKVDLESYLLAAPSIELAISRVAVGQYRIRSEQGVAQIERHGAKLAYHVVQGKDPLGYVGDPRAGALVGDGGASDRQWLEATAATEFPDAPTQVAQLLDSPRAGDLILTARPGWTPWHEPQKGLHGGLRREHMRVPLFLAGPGVRSGTVPVARTADVFPTLVEMLELPAQRGIDGTAIDWRVRGGGAE